MRKTIIALAIIGTVVNATPYTQQDRILDMQTMASAMQDIQNGFFYNNYDMIKEGSAKLVDTIVKIEPPLEEVEEKDIMTRYTNNKVQITNKIRKKIKKKTQDIVERFRAGDKIQAIQAYTKITKECMACHTQLRKW
ncbi:MAG: cytochrome C [Sulfurovum sp.]|nr:cytochrome C [Sulfurovaceae bacterium]